MEMETAKNQELKSKDKLSFEMILRKSFVSSVKEFCMNCSLAGAKQVFKPDLNIFSRIFWILLFCLSLSTVCYFLHYVWSDTLGKPLIVTLESSEYPIKEVDFPAVAICSINRISKKALARLATEEYAELAKKESLEVVQQSLANMGRLIDFSYNDTLPNNPVYRRMSDKYRLDNQKIIDTMKMLAPSCEDVLLKCAWDGFIVDCKDIFRTRRTANRGHCCTFNYLLNYHSFAKIGKSTKIAVKRQEMAGSRHGLQVVLDPMLDDYAYPLRGVQGFDVFIFDPMQFADPTAGRVIHKVADPDTGIFLELHATKQVASREVRNYAVDTRKCLFHNEFGGVFSDMYSYSSCLILCKLETVESLCKCTPFYYSASEEFMKSPICSLENLKCLNKYREKLFYLYPYGAEDFTGLETEAVDSLDCYECLPDCELTQHKTKSHVVPLKMENMDKAAIGTIFQELNASSLSYLNVYYPTPDAELVRLDVVSYWYEILSNLGGFCGICVGFSITSVIEVIYFFTIRYIHHCYINFKNHYQ